MSKYVWICLIFLLASGLAEGNESTRCLFTSDELLVKVHSEVAFDWSALARFERFARQLGAVSIEKIFPTLGPGVKPEIDRIYLLRFPDDKEPSQIINSLKQSPLTEDVDLNYLRRPCAERIEPNDAYYPEQWNLEAIRMPEAWSLNNGSNDLIIAVIDSGIDLQHEDLKDQFWRNPGEIPDNGIDDDGNGYVDDVVGWDFSDAPTLDGTGDYTRRDNDPSDESGHGTHVAGIACAQTNNAIGIAGIAWNCRLMPLRAGFNVASGGSFLQDDDVAAAIVYAADNGAKVINMSWGDLANAFVIRDAVNYAYQRGCVLVAAAGNSSDNFVLYPAALKNVISVGATDRNHQLAPMSNHGEGVDLFAPGMSILSTQIGNEYNTMSGTSTAAPHVSGLVGLILSKYPGLTNDDVRNILSVTTDRLNSLSYGYNYLPQIDAARSLASRLNLCAKIQVQYDRNAPDEILFFGNACGHGFEKYSIEYSESGKTTMPVETVRIYLSDIPAWNEELYRWNVSLLEEGIYTVRLNVFGRSRKPLIDRVLVPIDHSPPKITEPKVRRWLDGDEFYTMIAWKTDEETVCSISYRLYGQVVSSQKDDATFLDFQNLFTNKFSRTHNVNFSEFVGDGTYEFFITARNTVGLTSIDDNDGNYYHADVEHIRIGSGRFTRLPIYGLPKMHLIDTVVDFDNDGLGELIGMPIGGVGYSPVEIYEVERAAGSLKVERAAGSLGVERAAGSLGVERAAGSPKDINFQPVFRSDAYFPWAVGDSDRDGLLEILGNNYETTFLIESSGRTAVLSRSSGRTAVSSIKSKYPTERIFEMQGLWGGQFADLDLDGQIEIVSKNTNTNCIDIYENVGNNSYSRIASLANPTEGDNSFSANYAIGDFDGDEKIELVAGDADGDLFVYESIGNDQFIPVWHERLEDSINAYDFAVGDLDGDGRDDFVVGSKSADDKFGFENWHRNYFVYTANGNNSYRQIFKQQIRSARSSGNGIAIADVDADGMDELLIIAVPNAYVFKKGKSGLEVIWHHSAESTFRPSVLDIDNDGTNEILFNLDGGLGFFGLETDSRLTSRPYGLTATLINPNSVHLHWQSSGRTAVSSSEPLFYKIYRKTEGQFRLLADHVDENEFVDDSIIQGVTYWYAVSSVIPIERNDLIVTEYNNSIVDDGRETFLSDEVSITSKQFPRLVSAKYHPPNQVELTFDKKMGSSAQRRDNYHLVKGKGVKGQDVYVAWSVILDRSGKRAILSFDASIFSMGEYQIIVKDLKDADGIPIDQQFRSISFVVRSDVPQDLSQVTIYPNPVRPSQYGAYRLIFGNVPTGTEISIYTVSGELIEQLKVSENDDNKKIWWLSRRDKIISSGVYLCVFELRGQRVVKKFCVVR